MLQTAQGGLQASKGHSRLVMVPLPSCPARILEICRPRLKAWLKSRRVWNSDMKGNHERTAMGRKMRIPMVYSYILAISWMESHGPILRSTAPLLCLNLAQQGPRHAPPRQQEQHSTPSGSITNLRNSGPHTCAIYNTRGCYVTVV